MKGDYQKPLKRLTLFLLRTQALLMDNVIKNKRSLELATSLSSGYKIISQKISLLVIYYLTKFDSVIKSHSWAIPKITPENLCKPIHDIINYSISICSFKSRKCGKEEEKLQKFEHLKNKKSFLDEGLSLDEKIKIW